MVRELHHTGLEEVSDPVHEEGGLDQVDALPLDRGRAVAALGHLPGQGVERGEHPVGRGVAGRGREAQFAGVAVGQAAQRGGAVGVGGGDGGVRGDRRRPPVPEDRVARAAQQGRALLEEGRVPGPVRVEGADQRRVRDMVRPLDVEGRRGTAQSGHLPHSRIRSSGGTPIIGGGRKGAQDAGAGGQHQVGGGHPGEQGDLGVPAFGGQRGAIGRLVGVVPLGDLLLGDVEGDAAALHLESLAGAADLAEQRDRLLGRPVVDLPLHTRVVELRPAADQGPAHVDGDGTALRVQVEDPQHGRPRLSGQQARGALAEHGGVQRDLLVREVERVHPPVRLRVQGAAGSDEGGDVGDGVPDPVAGAPPGQVHRLVEVGGGGRVDGEEGEVGDVVRRQGGRLRRALRLLLGLGREALRDAEVGAERGEGGPERSLGGAGHADGTAGHTTERRHKAARAAFEDAAVPAERGSGTAPPGGHGQRRTLARRST